MNMLRQDIDLLETLFRTTAEKMRELANRLEGGFEPPNDDDIAQLSECRECFQQVVDRVTLELNNISCREQPPMKNLNELKRVEAKTRQYHFEHALNTLRKIGRLTHVTQRAFAPLLACQARASTLAERVRTWLRNPTEPLDVQSLLAETYPFECLIELIENEPNLDHQRADELESEIAKSFESGRHLSRDAQRRQILLSAYQMTESDGGSTAEATQPASELPSAVEEQSANVAPASTSPSENDNPQQTHLQNQAHHSDVSPNSQPPLPTDNRHAARRMLAKRTPLVGLLRADIDLTPEIRVEPPHSDELPLSNRSLLNNSIIARAANPVVSIGARKLVSLAHPKTTLSPEVTTDSHIETELNPIRVNSVLTDRDLDRTETFIANAISMTVAEQTESVVQAHSERPRATELEETPSPSDCTSSDSLPPALVVHKTSEFGLIFWDLLLEPSRRGLGYHISRCWEAIDDMEPLSLPSTVVRALALSPYINASSGEVVSEFLTQMRGLHEYAAHLDSAASDDKLAGTLILLACSLRPALLAPAANATPLLQQLQISTTMNSVNALRGAILKFTRLGIDLTPSIFKGVRDRLAWKSQFEKHRQECRDWCHNYSRAHLVYAPATYVLHKWLEPNGDIYKWFNVIFDNSTERINDVRCIIADWLSTSYVDEMIARTDREHRGRDAKRKEIDNTARRVLQTRVHEAANLLKRWTTILETEPKTGSSTAFMRAEDCRHEVLECFKNIRDSQELDDNSDSCWPTLRIARNILKRAICDLESLFDPAKEESLTPELKCIFSKELLAVQQLPLDPDWNPPPQMYGSDLLRILKEHINHNPHGDIDWVSIFNGHLLYGNFESADGILFLFETGGIGSFDNIEINKFKRAREKNLAEHQARLRDKHKSVTIAMEKAIPEDLFAESEVLQLRSTITSIVVSEVRHFAIVEAQLENVTQKIRRNREQRIAQAHERLKKLPSGINTEPVVRALNNEDLLTANEYISMIEQGDQILAAESEHRDIFKDFFPERLTRLQQWLDRTSKRDAIRALSSSTSDIPVTTDGLSADRSEEARKVLNFWLQASNAGSGKANDSHTKQIGEICEGIGFRKAQISPLDPPISEQVRAFSMQADIVSEQRTCVIPTYGSDAQGRYTLLCFWRNHTEDDIVDIARSIQRQSGPLIIMYFSRMNSTRRRDLARLCRKNRRTFLLLDENLIFFLAVEKGSRLLAFFSCTLPFAFVNPYTTTAGLVPSEVFFGRERERDSVFDPYGTCLVYGGRQLGKTALLRDVERRYHDPSKGSIVKWIDLKAEGIGTYKTIRDLWGIIARELHKEGVIATSTLGPDSLGSKVEDWLARETKNRIVLLLDEADTFLKSDAESEALRESQEAYPNLLRLKSIMDKTNRRFKVVFAGLHNVQRTSRDVNSPLAHLGTPICIGPLLENGEWREARKLVTLPFEQLGYRFEPPDDLPMRILAHASWYPSLVQLFCRHLLEYLTHATRLAFSASSSPPYMITARHIDEAYQSEELRKAIVDRFRWTLDLDPRYRVVALIIALESATNREGLISGYSVDWARKEALYWWPEGFGNTSTGEEFRTILDEMIGLGILRRVFGSCYALRSPNVLNLLGTKEDIEASLQDAMEHNPVPEYEATTFRRALDIKRSPLTAKQESELLVACNGVGIIFGALVSGLGDVTESLQRALASQLGEVDQNWHGIRDLAMFRGMLDKRISDRGDSLSLFVVSEDCSWNQKWVIAAAEKIRSLKSPKRFARVIFLGDTRKAWSWITQDQVDRARCAELEVLDFSLRPWHEKAVRRWLNDREIGPSGGGASALFENATGNWGQLLHEVADRCHKKGPHQWEKHLQEFYTEACTSTKWLDCFEIPNEPLTVLRTLAAMQDDLSFEEILSVVDELTTARVRCCIEWAELLGYVNRTGPERWQVNRYLGDLIRKHLV